MDKTKDDNGKKKKPAPPDDGKFYCRVCSLDYPTEIQYYDHKWSALHHNQMEKKYANFFHVCRLCGFETYVISEYLKHLIGQQHKEALEQRKAKAALERLQAEMAKKEAAKRAAEQELSQHWADRRMKQKRPRNDRLQHTEQYGRYNRFHQSSFRPHEHYRNQRETGYNGNNYYNNIGYQGNYNQQWGYQTNMAHWGYNSMDNYSYNYREPECFQWCNMNLEHNEFRPKTKTNPVTATAPGTRTITVTSSSKSSQPDMNTKTVSKCSRVTTAATSQLQQSNCGKTRVNVSSSKNTNTCSKAVNKVSSISEKTATNGTLLKEVITGIGMLFERKKNKMIRQKENAKVACTQKSPSLEHAKTIQEPGSNTVLENSLKTGSSCNILKTSGKQAKRNVELLNAISNKELTMENDTVSSSKGKNDKTLTKNCKNNCKESTTKTLTAHSNDSVTSKDTHSIGSVSETNTFKKSNSKAVQENLDVLPKVSATEDIISVINRSEDISSICDQHKSGGGDDSYSEKEGNFDSRSSLTEGFGKQATKLFKPNIGAARSRIHTGLRPQIEQSERTLQQRLVQMLGSSKSRHAQETEIAKLIKTKCLQKRLRKRYEIPLTSSGKQKPDDLTGNFLMKLGECSLTETTENEDPELMALLKAFSVEGDGNCSSKSKNYIDSGLTISSSSHTTVSCVIKQEPVETINEQAYGHADISENISKLRKRSEKKKRIEDSASAILSCNNTESVHKSVHKVVKDTDKLSINSNATTSNSGIVNGVVIKQEPLETIDEQTYGNAHISENISKLRERPEKKKRIEDSALAISSCQDTIPEIPSINNTESVHKGVHKVAENSDKISVNINATTSNSSIVNGVVIEQESKDPLENTNHCIIETSTNCSEIYLRNVRNKTLSDKHKHDFDVGTSSSFPKNMCVIPEVRVNEESLENNEVVDITEFAQESARHSVEKEKAMDQISKHSEMQLPSSNKPSISSASMPTSGMNNNLETLFDISVREESLHQEMKELDTSIQELKDVIQTKLMSLNKLQSTKEQLDKELRDLRGMRMQILEGARNGDSTNRKLAPIFPGDQKSNKQKTELPNPNQDYKVDTTSEELQPCSTTQSVSVPENRHGISDAFDDPATSGSDSVTTTCPPAIVLSAGDQNFDLQAVVSLLANPAILQQIQRNFTKLDQLPVELDKEALIVTLPENCSGSEIVKNNADTKNDPVLNQDIATAEDNLLEESKKDTPKRKRKLFSVDKESVKSPKRQSKRIKKAAENTSKTDKALKVVLVDCLESESKKNASSTQHTPADSKKKNETKQKCSHSKESGNDWRVGSEETRSDKPSVKDSPSKRLCKNRDKNSLQENTKKTSSVSTSVETAPSADLEDNSGKTSEANSNVGIGSSVQSTYNTSVSRDSPEEGSMKFIDFEDELLSLEVSDGILYCSCKDKAVRAYNLQSCKLKARYVNLNSNILCMALMKNKLFVSYADQSLCQFNLGNEKPEHTYHCSSNVICMHNSGNALYIGMQNGMVAVVNSTKHELKTKYEHSDAVGCITSTVRQKTKVLILASNTILIIDESTGKLVKRVKSSSKSVFVYVKAIGNLLYTADRTGSLYVNYISSGARKWIANIDSYFSSLHIVGQSVVSANGRRNVIKVSDLQTLKVTLEFIIKGEPLKFAHIHEEMMILGGKHLVCVYKPADHFLYGHDLQCRWKKCGLTLRSYEELVRHVEIHCKQNQTRECQWQKCKLSKKQFRHFNMHARMHMKELKKTRTFYLNKP